METTKTIETNTGMWDIMNVNTYETDLSPDRILDNILDGSENDGRIFNKEFVSQYYSFDKHCLFIRDSAVEFFETVKDDLLKLGITVKVGSLQSPSEYNFRGDELDLTVTYNPLKLYRIICEDSINYAEYLKGHYSSYDGFMSFTANNWDDWEEEFWEGREQEVSAALSYVVVGNIGFEDIEDIEDIDRHMVDAVIEEATFCGIEGLLDEEGSKIEKEARDKVNNYIADNYMSKTMEEMEIELDAWYEGRDWKWDGIEMIPYFRGRIFAIESQTEKLIFND